MSNTTDTIVERGLRITELEAEVKYLCFYKQNVYDCLGSGVDDVNNSINDEFVRSFGVDAMPPKEKRWYLERQDAKRREE